MHRPNPFSIPTLDVLNLIRQSPLRRIFPVVLFVLGLFALSPTARAVNPPPDGGYPGNNTAEGDGALQSVTSGFDDTAIGFRALYNNTSGGDNTANGVSVLSSNTTGDDNTATGSTALSSNTTGTRNTAN